MHDFYCRETLILFIFLLQRHQLPTHRDCKKGKSPLEHRLYRWLLIDRAPLCFFLASLLACDREVDSFITYLLHT